MSSSRAFSAENPQVPTELRLKLDAMAGFIDLTEAFTTHSDEADFPHVFGNVLRVRFLVLAGPQQGKACVSGHRDDRQAVFSRSFWSPEGPYKEEVGKVPQEGKTGCDRNREGLEGPSGM